jgi:hypothetical protein
MRYRPDGCDLFSQLQAEGVTSEHLCDFVSVVIDNDMSELASQQAIKAALRAHRIVTDDVLVIVLPASWAEQKGRPAHMWCHASTPTGAHHPALERAVRSVVIAALAALRASRPTASLTT